MSDTIFRKVESVLSPPSYHMVGDGFRVHNFFPNYSDTRMSPFFLMDYNSPFYFAPREKPRGVGPHPHRGLETVTIAYQGKVAHHDSVGNSGVIGEGDVQWMTAGAGILHKEYHESEFSRVGGIFQMVQIWVNLPAKDKSAPPAYQAIENKDMGKVVLEGQGVRADIIAGEFLGVKGPARAFTPMEMYNIFLDKNAHLEMNTNESYNTGFLVVKGKVKVNGNVEAPVDHFVLFGGEGEKIRVDAPEDCTLLFLSGEPINESMAPHGPFLMNTMEEIRQAYNDYKEGKFGFLE
jgi:quercetin 2,3-dioxygenase